MLKKFYLLFILLLPFSAMAQSLSLFDVDASSFPTIKAKFYAFDASGQQITNLNPTDFEVKENGTSRNVTFVSCPQPQPLQNVSLAMSIDVSGSMSYSGYGEIPVELGKTTAKELCNLVSMPPSEFALQTCDASPLIIQDFTTNKSKILTAIEPIIASGDNNFVEHLLNRLAGLLNIVKTGKNKRVAVLYTDAWWYALSSDELKQCKDTCTKYNIQFFAVLYSRPESEPNGIKKSLQELADFTGGSLYDGITTSEAAKKIGLKLQQTAQGGDPCEIQWQSGVSCFAGLTNVELTMLQNGTKATSIYQSPNTAVAKLEINPTSLKFENPTPGVYATPQKVIVTARDAAFTVSNISTEIPIGFDINPKSFSLKAGESIELTVTYFPADSGYNYCKFDVESQPCPTKFYVGGGWRGKKPTIRTIKLIHPNGGEVFVVGSDTVITWEGISPDEPVKIEYSTDNGASWITIADSATGLSYKWRVPRTPSNLCLARVTAKASFYEDYEEILICNQIWMVKNLDVLTYRNGDPIPEVTDPSQWENLTTGAWCYYNNDPVNGEIYGKLYNWYAVNDPRGLAPEGWHVPTDEEWTELENCLISNGYNYDGTTTGNKIAKALATESGWVSTSRAGAVGNTDYPAKRNASGFSALPGGCRYYFGTYNDVDFDSYWWSATEFNYTKTWHRGLSFNSSTVNSTNIYKVYGLSIRCVRD